MVCQLLVADVAVRSQFVAAASSQSLALEAALLIIIIKF